MEQGALSDLEAFVDSSRERKVQSKERGEGGLRSQQGRLCEIRKQGLGLWLRAVPSKGEDLI